jgi:hypothetical protein
MFFFCEQSRNKCYKTLRKNAISVWEKKSLLKGKGKIVAKSLENNPLLPEVTRSCWSEAAKNMFNFINIIIIFFVHLKKQLHVNLKNKYHYTAYHWYSSNRISLYFNIKKVSIYFVNYDVFNMIQHPNVQIKLAHHLFCCQSGLWAIFPRQERV